MADARVGDTRDAALDGVIPVEEAPVVIRGGVRGWMAAHPTASYLLRRFVIYVFTLWAAFTATFFFFRLIPGNPIGAYIANLQSAYNYNAQASAAVVAHYKAVFGLNGNLLQQYFAYMYQLIFKHNMGPSLLQYPTPSLVLVGRAVPWTVGLLGLSAVIAWFLGVILGALAGWTRGSRASDALTYIGLAAAHLPAYFIALILLLLFAFKLEWLPSGYAYDTGISVGISLPFILSMLRHAIIPAIALVGVGIAGNLLGMRQQMITVLGEDYLTFAKAKGLRPWHVLRRYGMPNCYLPQITGLMISFGFIFNGNVLIENLFTYPGVGHLLVLAEQQLDLNTMMAVTDIAIFMVLSAVFLIDMILPVLDPRIKFAR